MKKTTSALLMLIVSASSSADMPNLAKQKALDLIKKDPQHMSETKNQLDILLSGQAENQLKDATKRKEELKRRKKLQAQKLFNFAQQKHAEAVERRKAGLSLSSEAKLISDRKKTLLEASKNNEINKQLIAPNKSHPKYQDIYMPYDPHSKTIPDYKKDNFPNR